MRTWNAAARLVARPPQKSPAPHDSADAMPNAPEAISPNVITASVRRTRPADAQVDHLDEYRETHGEVDVALRNVHAEAIADERHADQQQERQREHLDGRMMVHELADRTRCEHHDGDGKDDRGDHHGYLVGHPDGGDDGVEREDDVEQHDLANDGAERRRGARRTVLALAFDSFVN